MKLEVDKDLVIPDDTKTLNEGALAPWNPISSKYYPTMLQQACEAFGIDMDTPFKDLPDKDKKLYCMELEIENFILNLKVTLVV